MNDPQIARSRDDQASERIFTTSGSTPWETEKIPLLNMAHLALRELHQLTAAKDKEVISFKIRCVVFVFRTPTKRTYEDQMDD